jgi:hypothetical protein
MWEMREADEGAWRRGGRVSWGSTGMAVVVALLVVLAVMLEVVVEVVVVVVGAAVLWRRRGLSGGALSSP